MASTADCESPYAYNPSLVLATVAVGLFALLTGVHLLQTLTSRAWTNSYFVIGGICQLTGYTFRLYSTQDFCSKAAYGVQAVLLRLGPSLMMFTVTAIHTEFIKTLHADPVCWIPLRAQHISYLSINLACLVIQTIGSIMQADASTRHTAVIASNLIIASYVTQMVFWGFLLAENTWVGIRIRAAIKRADAMGLSTTLSEQSVSTLKEQFPHWQRWAQLFGLAISIIGFGRNLMRLTELGVEFLQVNEWTSYAFDGFQMVVVMGAWGVFFLPGKCVDIRRTQERYKVLRMDRTGSA